MKTKLLTTLLSLSLVACGGGGGSSESPAPSVPVTPIVKPHLTTGYHVVGNKIYDPNNNEHRVRGVTMFDYLLDSFEARTDCRFRAPYPTRVPAQPLSSPTYYAKVQYRNHDHVYHQISRAKLYGVNLIRVAVEPAVMFATQSYVDPDDGQMYPSDYAMLDDIVNTAGTLGVVVQIQQVNDFCAKEHITAFVADLATRYKGKQHVWINPANEPGGMANNARDVDNVEMWQDKIGEYVSAIRGTGFVNPIVINSTGWGVNVNKVEYKLDNDPRFANDPNLIIGAHIYQIKPSDYSFRDLDLARVTDEWVKYTTKYPIIVDEVGINNYGKSYDASLNPQFGSVNPTDWINMQSWMIDFLSWARNHKDIQGVTGFNYDSYLPGGDIYDWNSMYQRNETMSTWGQIYLNSGR